MLTETTILDRLKRAIQVPLTGSILAGIGDDCAIYRPRGSADDLLFTTDLFVEGTHFERATHKAQDVARKAILRSISDIAAMGGEPRFCLTSVCFPSWADEKWAQQFFDAVAATTTLHKAYLIGGDLSHGEVFACDVTVCGAVPRGTALRRSGARPGDDLYVSGQLGGSAQGLASKKGKAWKRHLNPEPRLALGSFLREKLRATAAIDLSDGLSLDLQRVCTASGISARISEPPRFSGATADQALHGGEEYELLFTVRSGARVPRQFDGVPLTKIGTMERGPAGLVLLDGKPLEIRGYDHFRCDNLNQA